MISPRWDDPTFRVSSDSSRRARYRLLQSWYRETVLGLEAGRDSAGRRLGNLLPQAAVKSDPSLNFLRDDRLARVALERLAENRGTFVKGRLLHNLLSSQPLCVNLFGGLAFHPVEAASVLRSVSGLPVKRVDEVMIEVAPEAAVGILLDRTAFDAYIEYEADDGARCFLGIETKYTEPFSHDLDLGDEKRDKYRRIAVRSGAFRRPLGAELLTPKASQLFRNVLLGLSHSSTSQLRGHVLVVALEDDLTAAAGVQTVRDELVAPDDCLLSVSIESIIGAASKFPCFAGWAEHFSCRYLDLAPVAAAPAERGR